MSSKASQIWVYISDVNNYQHSHLDLHIIPFATILNVSQSGGKIKSYIFSTCPNPEQEPVKWKNMKKASLNSLPLAPSLLNFCHLPPLFMFPIDRRPLGPPPREVARTSKQEHEPEFGAGVIVDQTVKRIENLTVFHLIEAISMAG